MSSDPRNPLFTDLIPTESKHPAHFNVFKILVLLKIDCLSSHPIYFVIDAVATWEPDRNEFLQTQRYFYEEHTCPINFIRIPAIVQAGDMDPHGLGVA